MHSNSLLRMICCLPLAMALAVADELPVPAPVPDSGLDDTAGVDAARGAATLVTPPIPNVPSVPASPATTAPAVPAENEPPASDAASVPLQSDEEEEEDELILPEPTAAANDWIRSGPHAGWYTPRGTLGATYYRRSHPVPEDRHPRTGMLAVRDKGLVPHLSVPGMGGFRMRSGIWLFESSRPLDPGVCQIVRVEARKAVQEIEPYDARFVRLIPGRIVYLDYKEPIGEPGAVD